MEKDYTKYIQIITEQETLLRFESFTNQDALALGLKIIEKSAKYGGKPVGVRVDIDSFTVFYHTMNGTDASNGWWMQKKLNASLKTGKSSLLNRLEIVTLKNTSSYPWSLNEACYALWGGSFPINDKNGVPLGFVMTSGLDHQCDHQILADSLAEILGISIPTVLDGDLYKKPEGM